MSAHLRLAPREPIEASPEALATSGIVYESDDLFTGRSTTETGAPVHFGLTRLTAESLPFWRQYRLSAGRVADILARLARRLETPDDRLDLDALARRHSWSRDELVRVTAVMRRRRYAAKRVFRGVQGGVTGIEWVLDEAFAQTEDRFVAYAARRPLADRSPPPADTDDGDPARRLARHTACYAALLMTVGVATERGAPTVTHFGIFRNPLAFLDGGDEHRGLAMQLHGFAATVCRRVLADKLYMITNPMPSMTEILRRSMSPEDVYCGDSDAAVREYLNRDLPPHVPPLAAGRRFSFAGYSAGSLPTVVRLEALARFYRPAGVDNHHEHRPAPSASMARGNTR